MSSVKTKEINKEDITCHECGFEWLEGSTTTLYPYGGVVDDVGDFIVDFYCKDCLDRVSSI